MHALLLHNPKAGDGDHKGKALRSLLRKAGYSESYCSTKGKHFPDRLSEGADLFVVAGGDGTVGKVLKNMPDRSIPVLILPLGTANNIARSLGISGKPKGLLAGMRKARKQQFDIGLARGPWGRKLFVEAAGLGPLTDTMVRIDSVDIDRGDGIKLGRETFRKILGNAMPMRVHMSIDGQSFDEELLLAEILNIRYTGPGIALAPEGGLGDGLFDVVCVEPKQRKGMLAWLGASQPKSPPPVTFRQGRKIGLTWDGSPLRLDDRCPSTSKRGDRITVELERDSVTILVPQMAENKKSERRRAT